MGRLLVWEMDGLEESHLLEIAEWLEAAFGGGAESASILGGDLLV